MENALRFVETAKTGAYMIAMMETPKTEMDVIQIVWKNQVGYVDMVSKKEWISAPQFYPNSLAQTFMTIDI